MKTFRTTVFCMVGLAAAFYSAPHQLTEVRPLPDAAPRFADRPRVYSVSIFPIRCLGVCDPDMTKDRWWKIVAKMKSQKPIRSPSAMMHEMVNFWVFEQFPPEEFTYGRRCFYLLTLAGADPILGWDKRAGPLFFRDASGVVRLARFGEDGSESHPDQLLASLADIACPTYHPLGTERLSTTLRELLESSAWTIHEYQDLCWTLEALSRYWPHLRTWRSRDGSSWSLDRIAAILLSHPLGTGSCHGAHALRSLAICLRVDEQSPCLSDANRRAALRRLQRAVELLEESRTGDGSFSVAWHASRVKGRPFATDADVEKLHVAGHMLEWMLIAPEEVRIPDNLIAPPVAFCLSQLEIATSDEIGERICTYSHAFRSVRAWHRRTLENWGVSRYWFEG